MKILKRFKEPSSYAALSTVLMLFGVNIDPGLANNLATAGAALAGIAGFFLAEGKPDP